MSPVIKLGHVSRLSFWVYWLFCVVEWLFLVDLVSRLQRNGVSPLYSFWRYEGLVLYLLWALVSISFCYPSDCFYFYLFTWGLCCSYSVLRILSLEWMCVWLTAWAIFKKKDNPSPFPQNKKEGKQDCIDSCMHMSIDHWLMHMFIPGWLIYAYVYSLLIDLCICLFIIAVIDWFIYYLSLIAKCVSQSRKILLLLSFRSLSNLVVVF